MLVSPALARSKSLAASSRAAGGRSAGDWGFSGGDAPFVAVWLVSSVVG